MSLIDYSQRKGVQPDHSGIYSVDITNQNRQMIPRASAGFYRHLVTSNGFQRNSSVMGRMPYDDEFLYGTFPKHFVWSTSSAAYQIEGGWNSGGMLFTLFLVLL